MVQECDKLFLLATRRAVDLIHANRLLTTEEKKRDIEFYGDQKGDRLGKCDYQRPTVRQEDKGKATQNRVTGSRSQKRTCPGGSARGTKHNGDGCEGIDDGEAESDDNKAETEGDSDVNETGNQTKRRRRQL